MAANNGSPEPTQPLSVDKVITAGVQLYRSHFQDYFLLALKAYLWLLVPIYGWAKFYALTALISRLAFGELVNQPESISSGQRFVNSRLWQFFLAMVLLCLVFMGVSIGAGIIFATLALLSGLLIQPGNLAAFAFFSLIGLVIGIVVMLAVSWTLTRLYLVEVVLAVEKNVDSVSAISRTWQLTEGYAWRIVLIYFVWLLMNIPVQIALQILFSMISVFLPSLPWMYGVTLIAISFSVGALTEKRDASPWLQTWG